MQAETTTETWKKCGHPKFGNVAGVTKRQPGGRCRVCRDSSQAVYSAAWLNRNKERKAATNAAWLVRNKERKAATDAAWLARNQERRATTAAAYRKQNKERIAGYGAAWYRRNKERVDARNVTWYEANRERKAATQAAWYERNRERKAAATAVWLEQNRERKAATNAMHAWRRLGIPADFTWEAYKSLLAKQGHVCALCGKPPHRGRRLDVDHDHATGMVRGLLHSGCNWAIIGRYESNPRRIVNPALAARIAAYLTKEESREVQTASA